MGAQHAVEANQMETRVASTGAPRVLTWCPTCNIQLSEIVMPSTEAGFNLQHVMPYIAERIELLRPHFIHPGE